MAILSDFKLFSSQRGFLQNIFFSRAYEYSNIMAYLLSIYFFHRSLEEFLNIHRKKETISRLSSIVSAFEI